MATTPTFYIEDATVTTRSGEVPDASFDNGMNFGASNAPGVGINIGVADLPGTDEEFTLLDQRGLARDPQTSQHIGGNGLGDGVTGFLPDGSVRTAINDATGDGGIGVTREDVGLVDLAVGWEAPVV
jgi:hypothetical protein